MAKRVMLDVVPYYGPTIQIILSSWAQFYGYSAYCQRIENFFFYLLFHKIEFEDTINSLFNGGMVISPFDTSSCRTGRPNQQIDQSMIKETSNMKVSRRSFMLSTAGTVGAAMVASPFQSALAAKTFRYKYANNLPPSHPMNKRAKEMAKKIEEETDGRFKIGRAHV